MKKKNIFFWKKKQVIMQERNYLKINCIEEK